MNNERNERNGWEVSYWSHGWKRRTYYTSLDRVWGDNSFSTAATYARAIWETKVGC